VTDLRLRAVGAPAEEIERILSQGISGSKRLKPHNSTLAVQPWQFYDLLVGDIIAATFDARRTFIKTDGFVPPSFRPTADFLSKQILCEFDLCL
jgi:hypothetical protein